MDDGSGEASFIAMRMRFKDEVSSLVNARPVVLFKASYYAGF